MTLNSANKVTFLPCFPTKFESHLCSLVLATFNINNATSLPMYTYKRTNFAYYCQVVERSTCKYKFEFVIQIKILGYGYEVGLGTGKCDVTNITSSPSQHGSSL